MSQATKPKTIKVTVSYLPASDRFDEAFAPDVTLDSVRTDAMSHFGVANHTDRDVHEFFLESDEGRITDYSQTLAGLIGNRRRRLQLDLVEQVTAGGG